MSDALLLRKAESHAKLIQAGKGDEPYPRTGGLTPRKALHRMLEAHLYEAGDRTRLCAILGVGVERSMSAIVASAISTTSSAKDIATSNVIPLKPSPAPAATAVSTNKATTPAQSNVKPTNATFEQRLAVSGLSAEDQAEIRAAAERDQERNAQNKLHKAAVATARAMFGKPAPAAQTKPAPAASAPVPAHIAAARAMAAAKYGRR
ncbi:hypothetical protein [Oricola indica]|uniref:hypothetical protein n=1 Tax=Oricola indica TaxID=2872591 RepID=UPI001CBB0930|nr:hypothetical protein [Oricola indica]